MRRAVPAIALSAAGLTWLLHTQGIINGGDQTVTVGSGAAGEAAAGDGPPIPGEIVVTQYGPVQVAAVLRAGKLSDVQALQVPDGDANSKRINAEAIPKLRQGALAAQSARIDTVAGATFTSDGYRRSLQSALDRSGSDLGTGELAAAPTPTTAESTTTTVDLDALAKLFGSTTVAPQPAAPPTSAPAAKAGPNPTAAPAAGGAPASGTFRGPAVTHKYGPVEVAVAIGNGRITSVIATAPSEGKSAGINGDALPKLYQSVLTTQSARTMAAVSGATLTSEAFRQSLQAALDLAGFRG